MGAIKKLGVDLNMAVYVSAAMLALGVFLPLTNIPIYGDVSYHRIAKVEAFLVVVFALSAPVMLFLKQARRLFFAPVGVWVVLFFPALKSALTPKGSKGMLSGITDGASGVMGEFSARLFLNIASFEWGGLIFITALLTFTAACLLKALKS